MASAQQLATIVEGETTRLTIPLLEDGVALDGTGMTVSDVLLTGSDGQAVDTTGKFGWATQGSGLAYFDPASADFVAGKSPYHVRVKVTDGSSKVRFYPNGGRAEIVVLAARS